MSVQLDLLGIDGLAGIGSSLVAVGAIGLLDGLGQGAVYAEAVDLEPKFT